MLFAHFSTKQIFFFCFLKTSSGLLFVPFTHVSFLYAAILFHHFFSLFHLSLRLLSFILTGNWVSDEPQSLNLNPLKKWGGGSDTYIGPYLGPYIGPYIKKISNVSGNLKVAEQEASCVLVGGFPHSLAHAYEEHEMETTLWAVEVSLKKRVCLFLTFSDFVF